MNNIKYKLKLLDATDVLVAINILMFALTLLYSRGLQPNTQALVDFGGNATSYMKYGHEYWRFFTSMFLHANIIHLLVNMYSLKILGSTVEKIFGRRNFMIVYLFSGITGSAASYLVNTIMNANSLSVGASGAIFGLLGLLLSQKFIEKRNIMKGKLKRYVNIDYNNLIVIILVNLVIGFSISNIDNSAHIGGLIGGFLLGLIL
ncbi:rhomboid family intramembrane serine protease [bacterium]|nr:MAG: rhomboid family intramembrane serine protease [bacterium]